MVEFALVLPLFLIVMFIIADFGVGFSRWIVITNATREGARLGVVGTAPAEIQSRTAATSNGLLDAGDIVVNYQNFGGDPADPAEAGDAVVVSADYHYNMITPLGSFLSLTFGSITLSSCSDMRLELAVDDPAIVGGPGCDG